MELTDPVYLKVPKWREDRDYEKKMNKINSSSNKKVKSLSPH